MDLAVGPWSPLALLGGWLTARSAHSRRRATGLPEEKQALVQAGRRGSPRRETGESSAGDVVDYRPLEVRLSDSARRSRRVVAASSKRNAPAKPRIDMLIATRMKALSSVSETMSPVNTMPPAR
jgi:hypothetical protein